MPSKTSENAFLQCKMNLLSSLIFMPRRRNLSLDLVLSNFEGSEGRRKGLLKIFLFAVACFCANAKNRNPVFQVNGSPQFTVGKQI